MEIFVEKKDPSELGVFFCDNKNRNLALYISIKYILVVALSVINSLLHVASLLSLRMLKFVAKKIIFIVVVYFHLDMTIVDN